MIILNQIHVPVLLIAFNRPDTTKVVFERIRRAKPQILYIAIDGPRNNNLIDEKQVREVVRIVQEVDWHCNVSYKQNKQNRGAEVTVSSAISWVLEKEEYVIVLEDDIVAPLSFFRFADEMLIRYIDELKIATVTGSNFTPITVPGGGDYFFAKYGHSWGWGTWKRTWENYDLNLSIPDEHTDYSFLRKICNSRAEALYYQKRFKNMQKKGPGNNTWDNIGLYLHRINESLSVIPRVNLTSNIGVFGLHAKGKTKHHFRPVDENFEVRIHPDQIQCFQAYDEHHFKTYINKKTPLYKRIAKKIKNMGF